MDSLWRSLDKMGLIRKINNPLRQDEKDVTSKGAKKETERKSFVYLFIWEDVYIMAFKMGTTTNCS